MNIKVSLINVFFLLFVSANATADLLHCPASTDFIKKDGWCGWSWDLIDPLKMSGFNVTNNSYFTSPSVKTVLPQGSLKVTLTKMKYPSANPAFDDFGYEIEANCTYQLQDGEIEVKRSKYQDDADQNLDVSNWQKNSNNTYVCMTSVSSPEKCSFSP